MYLILCGMSVPRLNIFFSVSLVYFGQHKHMSLCVVFRRIVQRSWSLIQLKHSVDSIHSELSPNFPARLERYITIIKINSFFVTEDYQFVVKYLQLNIDMYWWPASGTSASWYLSGSSPDTFNWYHVYR